MTTPPSGPPPLPPKGSERRLKPRRRAKGLRVRITAPRAVSGFAADISETGVRLDVERPPLIPTGREVQLTFQLPGQPRAIRARGEVVRHVGHTAMGIRFLMLSLDERQSIAAYVESLTKGQ